MKAIYSSIPAQLCSYGLINSKTNHLKLYIYLKHVSSGHLTFTSTSYKTWSNDLGLSEKTVRKLIKDLLKAKWLTVNSKRNSLRVISYEQLCYKLDINSKLSAVYEPDDFSKFKEFCCAVVITHHLNIKFWRDKKRLSVSKMVGTTTNNTSCLKGIKTLPIRYFAKSLGVSVSTANSFKKSAEKGGFIEVKRMVMNMIDSNGQKIDKNMLSIIAEVDETFAQRLRKGRKNLKIVGADNIKSSIILKKKRFKHREKT